MSQRAGTSRCASEGQVVLEAGLSFKKLAAKTEGSRPQARGTLNVDVRPELSMVKKT